MKFTITFLSIFFYKTIDTLNDFSCIKLQLECFTKTYCRLRLLYRLPSSTSFFNCINREQICNQDQSREFNFFYSDTVKRLFKNKWSEKRQKGVERERERRSGTGENGYRTRIQAGLRTGPSCRWAWQRPDPHSQSRPRGHRYQRHQPVVLKHSKYVPGTLYYPTV